MQKIGSITSTADANGEWTNGNVAAGTAPTILDAAWLNTIQREIANVVTGAGLTLDPANDAQLLASLLSLTGPGRLLAVKYITASGTYTPTAGTKKIFVRGIGAGGNGGGSTATGSTGCTACSGGAAGSYAEAYFTSVPSSVAVTIGAPGSLTYSSGSAGGASIFGSLMTCPGGQGGNSAPFTTSVPFGISGQGSPGGLPAVTGASSSLVYWGAPGPCGSVFSGASISGFGANSQLGSGGLNASNTAGNAGIGYGAGGSGAGVPASSAAVYGGLGTKGCFIVWEYA